jgi:hypothetical protein
MPVAGHPYDLASLTGTSGAWLRWGVPLFYHWKFGSDLSLLAVGSQSFAYVLEHLGMSGAAAVATAWKVPLVLADLLIGVILVDLGKQLRSPRPGLIATLWLISPVPLWVSAAHGQIESLTVLAIVLSLDLVLRRRPLLAGVVTGLGIGVEYLPAMVGLIVVFWLYSSVMGRREVVRLAAGCAGALAFCFGPPLATDLGRTSLLGGLSFTANVASHPGAQTHASAPGASLWAVFDLSPGPFWLFTAMTAGAVLLAVLARKARRSDGAERERLGILAAGGLLLSVTILDPGALPQFSVLVLAGLCLIGLCLDLSPLVIIVGPFLQLAAGLLFVYGGSFQSYWFDMWATTGASGWPFPQSSRAATLAARLSAAVVELGLLLLASRLLRVEMPVRLRTFLARTAIVAGALGTAFFAVWSVQPGFWQGVGSQGPSTLPDFPLITQTQPGILSMTSGMAQITFSASQVQAARESSVKPALKLTLAADPFFAKTAANKAKFGDKTVQTVSIPGWPQEKGQVHSLWVSTLFGRHSWRSPTETLGGVPALMVRGKTVSSSKATWVAPGWAVVTYDIPASMISAKGKIKLGLREISSSGVLAWNGSPRVRWMVVSLHSGTAAATFDDKRWKGLVTLPAPAPSLWIQHVENATIEVPLEPRASFAVGQVKIGGQDAEIGGGSFTWPSAGPLDHSIRAPLLPILGVLDAIALIGGGLMLGRWVARSFKSRARVKLRRRAG